MASNNRLVLKIVLEMGRSAVLEKQQEEIQQVRKQYWGYLSACMPHLPLQQLQEYVHRCCRHLRLPAERSASVSRTVQSQREELNRCKAMLQGTMCYKFTRDLVEDLLCYEAMFIPPTPDCCDPEYGNHVPGCDGVDCYSHREELIGHRTGGQALRSDLQKLPFSMESPESEYNVVEDDCEPEVGYHRPGCNCGMQMSDPRVY